MKSIEKCTCFITPKQAVSSLSAGLKKMCCGKAFLLAKTEKRESMKESE